MITNGRQDTMLHQQIIQPGERLWTFCSLLQDYKLPFDLGHWQQPNTGCNIGTGSPLRIETFFFDRLEKTNGDDMSESTKHSKQSQARAEERGPRERSSPAASSTTRRRTACTPSAPQQEPQFPARPVRALPGIQIGAGSPAPRPKPQTRRRSRAFSFLAQK